MKNGQLKPVYNIQFSSSNHIVVHYSTGQTASDSIFYKTHLKSFYDCYGYYYPYAADAGPGKDFT